MCMTNHVKANISYQHRQEIQRTFREIIQGELCIDHFSINVFFGDNESMFFSPTPQMAEELCKKNFVTVDSNYKRSIYKKYSMYSWRSVAQNEVDVAINHIKEDKYDDIADLAIPGVPETYEAFTRQVELHTAEQEKERQNVSFNTTYRGKYHHRR